MRTRNIKVGQEYAVKIRQRNNSLLHIYRATIIATNQRRRLTEQNYWNTTADYANDGVKVRFHSHPDSEPITSIVRPHEVLRPWEAHEKILEERREAQKSRDADRAKIKAEQAKKNKPAVAALDKAYGNNRSKFGWMHSYWRQQLVDGSTSQVALTTDIIIALAELQPRKKPAKKVPAKKVAAKKAARKPVAKKATAKKAPAKRRPRQS